tara:strand:+ start:185 stop:679 length:495 start_codon:yes stop_codon:yes gene_type:complete
MEILMTSTVHFVKFNPMLETTLKQSKMKMFRAGFTKLNGSYRHGKFDLRKRTKFKNDKGNIKTINGKGRTTNPERVLQSFEPSINRYTNMIYDNILWFSMGKKLYTISRLDSEHYKWSLISSENYKLLDVLTNPKETHKDSNGKSYYAVPNVLIDQYIKENINE